MIIGYVQTTLSQDPTGLVAQRSKKRSLLRPISGIFLSGLRRIRCAGIASKSCSCISLIMLTQSCDRKAHDADPIDWAKTYTSKHDRTFRYSRNTGTSALRGHVDRLHLLEYVTLAEANGWPVWLESVKSAIARGYLLGEIRDALTNGGSLTQ